MKEVCIEEYPLSPILFKGVLEENGLDLYGRKVSNLRFADDVTLMIDSFNDLRDVIHELNIKSKIAGLSINYLKKIMKNVKRPSLRKNCT